jgi:hypothetical protein
MFLPDTRKGMRSASFVRRGIAPRHFFPNANELSAEEFRTSIGRKTASVAAA